ncbi:hypothetical protein Tco_0971482 [Tanacetum coccineum]
MANQTCSKKPLRPYAPPFYPSRFNHHHASRTICTNKWSVHFPVATGPSNCVVPNRKPKDKPRFNKGAQRLFIKKQHHREIILKLDPSDHVSTSVMIRNIPNNYTREGRVSTDHAKLVPLGKVCTAKESLEKNTAKGTKCKLEPLISLTDDLSLLSNMAALESCPKHNMIAYLEKTEGNVEFHEVIDFLRRSYIYHALTVSPVVSTTFVEQFWTSAKSKTINNVRHITAKVAGKSGCYLGGINPN